MRTILILALTSFVHAADVLHILSTGQSLATGAYATPILSSSQPYNNIMLSPGVEGASGPLLALIENGTGQNGSVETPSSGIANTLRALDPLGRAVIVGLHGYDGLRYVDLAKGTPRYQLGMTQASMTKSLVESMGNTYRPIAVTAYHGESDGCAIGPPITPPAQYTADLVQWQSDYEADLNALTGTVNTIPLYINQMNTCDGNIPVSQLAAHMQDRGRVILVGPKYQYVYDSDATHITNLSTRYSAELMGKVIKKVFIDHQIWNPLMPEQVSRAGSLVTITFNVPVEPLVVDTALLAANANYGFDFVQTGGNVVSVSSVTIVGSRQIQIQLSDVPTGQSQSIRYAWGRKGNIRDSDASVSPAKDSTGLPLYNWCVTFDQPIVGQQARPAIPQKK